MAAGDYPYMVHSGRVSWENEGSNHGTAPAGATWNSFGYRLGDLRDLGPTNAWNLHRAWSSPYAMEARNLDLLMQDYGGPLGEFKLTDLRVPGFWWGQEPAVPVATGSGGFRHTLAPTANHPAPSKSIQIHDQDGSGTTTRQTALNCVMTELEMAGNEAGEVSFTPNYIAQDADIGATALKTVVEPTTGSYYHFHGSITVFGVQLLRVVSWRFRAMRGASRARYWSQVNPRLAYEYPLEDANYVFSARCVADGKQFPTFGNRDLKAAARNGDITSAILKWVKTTGVDEAQINIGSAADALGIIGTPRVKPAGGGKVMYEIDFAARTSQYQYVDASNVQYFPA